MIDKSIGVFDSGLGGLTVVRELKKILPSENIVYFGDTARIPYGSKSHKTIYKYTQDDINFLLTKDVKAIVVACGTASSVIDENIIKKTPIPIISVIPPAVKKAVSLTKNNNIGVVATGSTVNSQSYTREIERNQKKITKYKVYPRACPLFVPLVENGYFHKNDQVARLVAEDYLSYFNDKNIDTLILGCTHYPLLYDLIKNIMGEKVDLVDAGKEAAVRTMELLEEKNLLGNSNKTSVIDFYVSDKPFDFKEQAEIFLGERINNGVTEVSLEEIYGN